jgi:hypothetical protein
MEHTLKCPPFLNELSNPEKGLLHFVLFQRPYPPKAPSPVALALTILGQLPLSYFNGMAGSENDCHMIPEADFYILPETAEMVEPSDPPAISLSDPESHLSDVLDLNFRSVFYLRRVCRMFPLYYYFFERPILRFGYRFQCSPKPMENSPLRAVSNAI